MEQHCSPLCIRRYHKICLGLIFGGYASEPYPDTRPWTSRGVGTLGPNSPTTERVADRLVAGAPVQRLCRARHPLAPHYHLVGPASGPHPPLADRAGHLRGACGRSGFCGGGEANRGARHLMQPGVQVRKRAAKGAAARLLTAGPRNRKPLSFHEIKPDSGLMKGRGGDSAGGRSGQLKFDLREGQQLVAAFAGVGAGRSQVRRHNRHLELGPKTYCRVWFGRPARGRWTEDGRRQARIRTRVWVDRWCHSWHTEGELACARFHAPWLDCSRLDTRSEEQEDEDSALQVCR